MQGLTIGEHLGDSDHNMLHFLLTCKQSVLNNCMRVPNFSRANYGGVCEMLGSFQWPGILGEESTEEMWLKSRESFQAGIRDFIPLKIRRSGQKHSCMWFNEQVQGKFNRKQVLFNEL